jgi:hypothetical protein
MFLLPEKVSVVISPVTATMAKHDELHLWIHRLDMLSG